MRMKNGKLFSRVYCLKRKSIAYMMNIRPLRWDWERYLLCVRNHAFWSCRCEKPWAIIVRVDFARNATSEADLDSYDVWMWEKKKKIKRWNFLPSIHRSRYHLIFTAKTSCLLFSLHSSRRFTNKSLISHAVPGSVCFGAYGNALRGWYNSISSWECNRGNRYRRSVLF